MEFYLSVSVTNNFKTKECNLNVTAVLLIAAFICSICFFLVACVSSAKIDLPKLTVNAKSSNNRITNRRPDYGDGHRDGCIVLPAMHMFLNTKTRGKVSGRVTSVDRQVGLAGVTIGIRDEEGTDYISSTDSLGNFAVELQAAMETIQAQTVGYRTLEVNF